MTGRSINEVITNGVYQYKCIDALSKKYGSIANVIIMDLSVEADLKSINISGK